VFHIRVPKNKGQVLDKVREKLCVPHEQEQIQSTPAVALEEDCYDSDATLAESEAPNTDENSRIQGRKRSAGSKGKQQQRWDRTRIKELECRTPW